MIPTVFELSLPVIANRIVDVALVLLTSKSHDKFLIKDSTSIGGLEGKKGILIFNKWLSS